MYERSLTQECRTLSGRQAGGGLNDSSSADVTGRTRARRGAAHTHAASPSGRCCRPIDVAATAYVCGGGGGGSGAAEQRRRRPRASRPGPSVVGVDTVSNRGRHLTTNADHFAATVGLFLCNGCTRREKGDVQKTKNNFQKRYKPPSVRGCYLSARDNVFFLRRVIAMSWLECDVRNINFRESPF